MTIVIAFILGMNFGAAGLFAKQINTVAGFAIANRGMHNYFTSLGRLSNTIFPILAVVAAIAAQGVIFGVVVFVSTLLGALVLGFFNPSYKIKMLISLIGLPVTLLIFFLSFGM